MRREIDLVMLERVMSHLNMELLRRFDQHGTGAMASPHEIRGVLDEEVEELHEAIRENDGVGTYNELFDVAVAALVGCMSLYEEVQIGKGKASGLVPL